MNTHESNEIPAHVLRAIAERETYLAAAAAAGIEAW